VEIIRGTKNLARKFKNSAITIGNFDGIHLGHQEIFKKVKQRASELNGNSMVYTFDPHPLNVLAPHKKVPIITSFSEKMKLIEESKIDIVICEDFTPEYANLSPRQFVEDILLDKIGIKAIFVGHDYAFGKGRQGNISTLKQFGEELDFEVRVVDAIKVDDILVSSTKIRGFVQEGEVKKVARLMGRYYSITGRVGRGKSRGKGMGFPTANLRSVEELFPRPGIYVVHVFYRGRSYHGVVNIGFNPTFKDQTLSVEVFIMDFNKDIYGEDVRISFVDRLRDEKAFDSPDELVEQIKKDVEKAREILKE